ncbi:MAG: hypothetical protein IPI67_15295 [Myxococcales bacterium]|nr:hypothetical protein [Myxococcales bacterium]
MPPARPQHLLALFSALSCVAAGAGAQPNPKPVTGLSDDAELARVITLYDGGKYLECAKEFAQLLESEPRKIEDPDVLERARIYYAACLIGNSQIPLAEEQMRKAIRQNPQMRAPDSLVFPAPVIDRFFKVRDSMLDEIKRSEAEQLAKKRAAAAAAAQRAADEKRRVERLEELAGREVLVTRNSRWAAAVPFGAGQFQNRDPLLGYIFLGTEAVLAATVLTTMVLELQLNARADDDPPPDPADLNPKLANAQRVLVISSWSFVGVAALGVLQAQLAYVPEFRDVVKKPLAPDLRRPAEAEGMSLRPVLLPSPGGAELNIVGRF